MTKKKVLNNYTRLNRGKLCELKRRYYKLSHLEIEGLVAESWVILFEKANFAKSYNEVISLWNMIIRTLFANYFRRLQKKPMFYLSPEKMQERGLK